VHLDDAVAAHFGRGRHAEEAAALVVLESKLVVLPATGPARTIRLPLGPHAVGCSAAIADGRSPPGALIGLDLPGAGGAITAALLYYPDPARDETPQTIELPAAARAACLSMSAHTPPLSSAKLPHR